MTTPINEFTPKLLAAIKSKDASASLALIQEYKTAISTSGDYIVWITDPANLTNVQTSITESFGIPQKAMMIKPRPGASRGLRASFFLQAMENSLKRVI